MGVMDVVIITLRRKSLARTIQSAYEVIPEANIILVTDKMRSDLTLGMLRNKGLAKACSEYTCFLDDDIVVNKNWYDKSMKRLQNESTIVVAGRTSTIDTLGCMICKTKQFKEVGGFPKLDSFLDDKLGDRFVVVSDAICEHQAPRGLAVIQHTLRYLTVAFQAETKVGVYHNPIWSVKQIFSYLKKGWPDYVIGELFWIVKTLFSLPFIVSIGHKEADKK
jgi:glycosyltransferase involved in cell wall biosynthesis